MRHITLLEILKILKGEKLEPEKEKHFFNCKKCQERFYSLEYFEDANIEISKDFEDESIDMLCVLTHFFQINVIKGVYVSGYTTRGIGENLEKRTEHTHTIKASNVTIDIRRIGEEVHLDTLEVKKPLLLKLVNEENTFDYKIEKAGQIFSIPFLFKPLLIKIIKLD